MASSRSDKCSSHFRNARKARESTKSCVTEGEDEVWANTLNFVTKSFKFSAKLSVYIIACLNCRETANCVLNVSCAEVEEVVLWWSAVKDVGEEAVILFDLRLG